MWAEYSTEEALDITDDFLDEIVLDMVVLPLVALIWIFSGMVLNSWGLDIAENKEEVFKFAISLLGTIIQDGGTRKRSNDSSLLKRLYIIYY